jgi:peptide/nickel transport system substrate-binding protein
MGKDIGSKDPRVQKKEQQGEAMYDMPKHIVSGIGGQGLTRRELLGRGGAVIGATTLAILCGYGYRISPVIAADGAPKRGGTLRYANTDTLKPLTDPALVDALGPSDAVRGVAEFLTYVDSGNLPHPYLLESLDTTSDLKTWTLKLREGPTFNTPTPRHIDADDVIFNLKRWLDAKLGSSMTGLLSPYLDVSGIERVDDRTVRLNLKAPTNTLPYDLYHYAGAIMPREFEGDFLKQPWGTGPFELVEYVPNEKFTLKARKGYWQKGADGQPLPYLDGVISLDVKSQSAAYVAGLVSNQFDLALGMDVSAYRTLQQHPEIMLSKVRSAGTLLFRMHADEKPFSDERVRLALKLVQNRKQITDLALGDTAFLGTDDFVAPEVDPAWYPMDPPAQDIARAKQLLAEAGFANGFQTELRYPAAPEFIGTASQVYAGQAKQIGVDIKLVPMPADAYWAKWTDWTFGAPYWSHRPLATMTLGLAMRSGASWNESHWADKTFDKLLDEATATVSVEDRRKVYAKLQPYLREHGPMAEPLFIYALAAQTKRVQNFKPTAFRYGVFTDTWMA